MIFDKDDFKAYDADLWNAIAKEEERQQNNIELIASENVVSKAVMAAQGSILTNKYAEGYPGRRYYGGTDVVDVVESLAIERAKEIFGAKFANVQPHSGSQANCAAYMALETTFSEAINSMLFCWRSSSLAIAFQRSASYALKSSLSKIIGLLLYSVTGPSAWFYNKKIN